MKINHGNLWRGNLKPSISFTNSGATRAVALDMSKAFDRVWHAGLLHKLQFYGILGQILALFLLSSVIDGFGWFRMGSPHKNI